MVAIKRGKELKEIKMQTQMDLMEKLNTINQKQQLTEEDIKDLICIQSKFDQYYLDLAKGAYIRSRVKWLKEGEKNSNFFFFQLKKGMQNETLLQP